MSIHSKSSNPVVGNKNRGSNKPLFSWLAWRDAFRTFEWERAFPDPVVSLTQVRELLALN